MTGKSTFGSETRAQDGLLATFELEDGSVVVERFSQVIRSRTTKGVRVLIKDGTQTIEQVVARADILGAQILCLSSPETIVTDMKGSRIARDAARTEDRVRMGVQFPEMNMLGRVGRSELFKQPTHTSHAEQRTLRAHRRRGR